MLFFKHRSVIREYTSILLGTVFMAISIKSIYDAMGLVTGGFTGISIMIKGMSEAYAGRGIPLWFTNLLLNLPLFTIAMMLKGSRFLRKSLFGTLFLSVWLYLLPRISLIQGDILLTALFGGLLSGIGIGLVLRAGATTGGVDLLATLIHDRYRHFAIVQIMLVIDAVIIISGAYLFGMNCALYAVLAVYVTTRVSDLIVEGSKFAKVVYIITEKYEEAALMIMEELERGATAPDARGMYSGEEKDVLFCVVSKKETVRLKEMIHQLDRNAFVIVTDAKEVLGEGFIMESA